MKRLFILLFIGVMPSLVIASQGMTGAPKNITYRGGYVMFKVTDPATDVNACAACPIGPGGYNAGHCWISDTKKAQLSLLLMAKAMGNQVKGRADNLTSACEVNELSVLD
ncbi:hypothetical protein ACFL2V_01120 [Pseudomonadota bacterium]